MKSKTRLSPEATAIWSTPYHKHPGDDSTKFKSALENAEKNAGDDGSIDVSQLVRERCGWLTDRRAILMAA